MKKSAFERNYFEGKWPTGSTSSFFSTYYWARCFYADLIKNRIRRGRVLEIGSGLGDLLGFLDNQYKTYGVEISKYACNLAKKRAPEAKIINKDAYSYLKSLPNGALSAVVQICVLPHMRKPERVINEISRVLKKNGILLSVVPNPRYPLMRLKGEASSAYRDKTHINLYDNEKWLRLFEKSGLKTKIKGSTGWWDVPYIPLVPKILQLVVFGFPSIIQIFSGKIILPSWMGVDLITISEKV